MVEWLIAFIMLVSDPNNVKIYNLSAGKSLPEVCFYFCCRLSRMAKLHTLTCQQSRCNEGYKLRLSLHVDASSYLKSFFSGDST